MAQAYRDQFSHFLNTTPTGSQATWTLEGIGVDSLSLAYNPQVDQYKTIIQRNSSATFKNYQIQSSVSGKRIYTDDAIYTFLNDARRDAKAVETQLLEVDMSKTVSSGSYEAVKYNVLIVINEFLGEDATISYDLYVTSDPIKGTATISGGVPTFVEAA